MLSLHGGEGLLLRKLDSGLLRLWYVRASVLHVNSFPDTTMLAEKSAHLAVADPLVLPARQRWQLCYDLQCQLCSSLSSCAIKSNSPA